MHSNNLRRPQNICNVILKQILMNAPRLVLVVDSCASTPLGPTTVAVALDTDWSLMDTHAMVFNMQNAKTYSFI